MATASRRGGLSGEYHHYTVDTLISLFAALDPEVLIQQRAVHALHYAVGLRSPGAGGAVFELLELVK